MAKKGRVARILTTLHRVAGTPISEAFARDDDARLREREEVLRTRENDEVVAKTMIMRKPGEEEDGGGKGGER